MQTPKQDSMHYGRENLPSSEALHSIRVHVQMHGENEAVLHEDKTTLAKQADP
jgi:hypothetical protein